MKKRYCGRVPLRMVTMPLAACANARFTVTWGGRGFTVFFFLRLIKIEKDWMSRGVRDGPFLFKVELKRSLKLEV